MSDIDYEKTVATLKEMVELQCSDGNWNYNNYMHGMANGMIFALALFEGGEIPYLDAPDTWLVDAVETELVKQEESKC